MASATHLIPTSPLSVMVPNPRRGICTPLLRVTSGVRFFRVLVFGAAKDCALPRPRNMAEAAHPALVCKNWRRLIPLELRSLFILVDISHIVSSPRPARAFFVILCLLHRLARLFFGSPSIFLWHRGCFGAFLARMPCFSRMRRHLLRGFQYSPAMVESLPSS